MHPTSQQWLALYEAMVRTRTAEQHLDLQFRQGRLRGLGHWSTGLEAIGVATGMALGDDDVLFPTHRGYPEYIGKGMSVHSIYAEVAGKATGCSRGRGGGSHCCDPERGLWGKTASLGTDFSMAVGTALAFKFQNLDRVACKLFGEGAYTQKDFHPAMLMAVRWHVPVVFVLNLNQWIEHHHYRTVIATPDIYKVAAAHGMHAQVVEDGNDVVAVYDAVSDAVARARSGSGPAFVECRSYRLAGHHNGDSAQYLPPDEVAHWRARDPIARCRQGLLAAGLLTEQRDAEIRARIQAEIEAAADQAAQDPEPDPAAVTHGAYAGVEVNPW